MRKPPWTLLRQLRHDESGNVAIIFALALISIVTVVGAAVDYSWANKAKAHLDAAADAATLAGVNRSALSTTTSAAKTTALNMFNAQAIAMDRVSVSTVSANVTDSGMARTAVVNYAATVPTAFMGLVGINAMTIKGTSTATSAISSYVDFYLLLDNTPSMGVGATPADVTKMVNNTPDKCAFACHQLDISPNDYYGKAKKLGVKMRIDVVRTATQTLIDTASATQTVSGQFRMAIYTFGSSAKTAGLTTIAALTSSLSSAKTAAANIDLMTVPYQNYAADTDTNFDAIFPAVNKAISTPGDGSKSTAPQKILFFVSDGVADEVNATTCSQPTILRKDFKTNLTYVRCQEPITVSLCTAIKNRGIKIAVLYTTYLPLPTNDWYNSWIAPFYSKIATNMQSCASPGLYFEVNPTQGISDAMNALFNKVVASAHLTH